jgi:hypothetical protein
MKIPTIWSEFFYAGRRMDGRTDGQTVMTNLIVPFFCDFTKASKNDYFLRIYYSYLHDSFRCSQYLSYEIGYTCTYKIYITYVICFDYVEDICLHLGTFHTSFPLDTFLCAQWICIPLIINRKSIKYIFKINLNIVKYCKVHPQRFVCMGSSYWKLVMSLDFYRISSSYIQTL